MSSLETNQGVLESNFESTADEPISRYVVVGLYKNLYGISTDSTVELMGSDVAQITRVPNSPKFISGVINHRGSIIPVIDTRVLLGFQTNAVEIAEMIEMLNQREQDHVNWLNELKRCVQRTEEFTKARDPNLCAFGKWYNNLMASESAMQYLTKGDASLRGLLVHFGAPHARIHAIADRVLDLSSEGRQEQAIEIIDRAWDTDLRSMRELFKKVCETIQKIHVSMMIITELGDRKAALLVDAVYTVKDVTDSAVESLPESAENQQFLKGLVHEEDGSYVLITDLASIYDTACADEGSDNDG